MEACFCPLERQAVPYRLPYCWEEQYSPSSHSTSPLARTAMLATVPALLSKEGAGVRRQQSPGERRKDRSHHCFSLQQQWLFCPGLHPQSRESQLCLHFWDVLSQLCVWIPESKTVQGKHTKITNFYMLLVHTSIQIDQQFLVENHLWQSQTRRYAGRSHGEDSFSLIHNKSEEQSLPRKHHLQYS